MYKEYKMTTQTNNSTVSNQLPTLDEMTDQFVSRLSLLELFGRRDADAAMDIATVEDLWEKAMDLHGKNRMKGLYSARDARNAASKALLEAGCRNFPTIVAERASKIHVPFLARIKVALETASNVEVKFMKRVYAIHDIDILLEVNEQIGDVKQAQNFLRSYEAKVIKAVNSYGPDSDEAKDATYLVRDYVDEVTNAINKVLEADAKHSARDIEGATGFILRALAKFTEITTSRREAEEARNQMRARIVKGQQRVAKRDQRANKNGHQKRNQNREVVEKLTGQFA